MKKKEDKYDKIYMYGIEYVCGKKSNLNEIVKFKNDCELRERFIEEGFEYFCKTDKSPLNLASLSIERTINEIDIDRADYKYVVYVCENNEGLHGHKILHSLCERHGLVNAYPIGVYLTGCGNYSTAMQLSESLILSGMAENILLVTVDTTEIDEKRIVPPSIALMSDGAASCVITNREIENTKGMEVLGTEVHVEHEMVKYDPVIDFLKYNVENYKKHEIVYRKIVERLKLSKSDIGSLISQNLSISALDVFCDRFGIDEGKNYRKNIGRIGHAGSADNLINTKDYASSNEMDNKIILSLATGPYTWGITALRAIG